jgi:predicted nucleic-acid-binding Zn-ribbon protein
LTDFEEKVIDLLETINEKLDQLLGGRASQSHMSTSGSTSSTAGSVRPSEVVEKQEEEEKLKKKPPIEGRRVCPKCGGTDFNEQEDRSNVLHQQGGMKIYAKKYTCKSCGYTFPT